MTQPSIRTTEGVFIDVTNHEGDDFMQGVVSVKATHPTGPAILWKLPERLMRRMDVCHAVLEEIYDALEEGVRAAEARKASPFRSVRVDP